MRRKIFCPALCTMLFALCIPAEAQQPKKVPRIGYLSPLSLSVGGGEEFRQGLHELGYVEGKNILIEYRWAEGRLDRLPELAAELVRMKLDVIVTRGTLPTRALKDATATIPIVVLGAGDLVGRGLVASLARPGGNITGSTSIAPDLSGKRLELLKETVPKITRVAVFYQPQEEDELRATQAAARPLGIQIQSLEIKESSQFENAYAAMRTERADGLIVFSNPFTNFNRRQLIDLSVKNRLPAMCEGMEWTNDGCLISYAPNLADLARRAATYVDKILRGAKPADLPVEQPTKFELVINLKTAKQIGLTIPPNILARADRVIR